MMKIFTRSFLCLVVLSVFVLSMSFFSTTAMAQKNTTAVKLTKEKGFVIEYPSSALMKELDGKKLTRADLSSILSKHRLEISDEVTEALKSPSETIAGCYKCGIFLCCD